MKQPIIIGMDIGKFNSNVVTSTGESCNFLTRVQETTDEVLVNSTGKLVEYDGKKYLVGDENNVEANYETTKATIEHKICFLRGIAEVVPNESDVIVLLGTPILLYNNAEQRKKVIRYFSQPKTASRTFVKVEGRMHAFNLKAVYAVPETAGYIFRHISTCMNDVVGIIDIGGLNTNATVYNNLGFVTKSILTDNEGGYYLHERVKERIIGDTGENVQDYEVIQLLNGLSTKNGKVRRSDYRLAAESVIHEYLGLLVKKLQKKQWNLENSTVVLTGGTSRIVGPYATKYFPNLVISDDPVWDNAKGFLEFGIAELS